MHHVTWYTLQVALALQPQGRHVLSALNPNTRAIVPGAPKVQETTELQRPLQIPIHPPFLQLRASQSTLEHHGKLQTPT